MKWQIWALRIIPAAILLQTLFFKFTGAPEAIQIFTALGAEPWGRYLIGTFELITGILLISPRYAWGALLGIGLMLGAIMSHVLVLGIASNGDGGLLFILALVVLACSTTLTWMEREAFLTLLKRGA